MPLMFGDRPQGMVSQIMNLEEVLLRPALLRVPPYQRPFTWTQKEVSELLDDLLAAFAGAAPAYFTGQLVFIRNGHDLDIADGQQRLTTLTMLLAYARDRLPADSSALQRLIIAAATIGRLRLRPSDDAFFAKGVQTAGAFQTLRTTENAANDAQECLVSAAKEITEALEELSDEELSRFVRFVASRATFNVVDCDRPAGAATFFVAMNHRRKNLSGPDILKGELLGAPELSKTDVQEAARLWEDYEDRAGRETFERLLRYMPLLMRTGPIASRETVGVLAETLSKTGGARAFLMQRLPAFAEAMLEVCHANVAAGEESAEVNRRIRCLQLVENEIWEPMAIKYLAHRAEARPGAGRFFLLFERFIAGCILGQVDPKMRRGRLSHAWNAIQNDALLTGAASPLEFTGALRAKLLSRLAEPSKRDPVRRYLVLRVNAALGEALTVTADASVEHVLPNRPTPYWRERFPQSYSEYANMIGNYVLLTDKQNRAAENKSYEEKLVIYAAADAPQRALTRDLLNYAEWTMQTLDARHERLVRIMSKEWELSPRAG